MAITRKIPNFKPRVELFGDWDKAERALINLPNAISVGTNLGRSAALKELERQIKQNIRNNGGSIGWQPLAERTLNNKKDSKYPTSILRMTGLYYKSIMQWSDNSTGAMFLGLKSRTYYPDKGASGLTVQQVAKVLEYGSSIRNIPARPLWRPTFRMFGGNARIKGYIIWHVRNQIMLQCGIKAKVTI